MQTREPRSQFSTLIWFILAAIIALPISGCLVLLVGTRLLIHAVVVGETGPVETRDKWPDPIKKLAEDRQDIAFDTIKVYQLCQGFDPEYVLRIDAPIELLDYVVEKWELTQVPSPRLPSVFNGRSQISGVSTPEWWKPSQIPDIRYYVCPRTLAGEKGDRFQVAYSETANVLYLHYWFNF